MTSAIEARNLIKTYGKDILALQDLSFSVEEGTIFGLLGPNGAGKTTAVKILTTLSRPDSGEGSVAGFDIARNPEEVRHRIGVVGQLNGSDQDATGLENLILQGQIYGLRRHDLRPRAAYLLERFGLAEAARRVVRGYSGGMRRRLDIAMAIIHRPHVLFLDEPTTGLDPEVRTALWQEITRLRDEDGVTSLVTTHYLEEADQLADQLAIVDRGRTVAEGTPEGLKTSLHGDSVHVELVEPPPDDEIDRVLARVADVRETTIMGASLRTRAVNGATAVPTVLAALEAHGLKAMAITVSRPSLQDVYLRITGRTFRDADLAGTPANGSPAVQKGTTR
jgi:ABC-2 type transport system ATP-binding protein